MNITGSVPESVIYIRTYGASKAQIKKTVGKTAQELGKYGTCRVDWGYRKPKKKK